MVEKRISAVYVKMALQRSSYLQNTKAIAVSTVYRPIPGRDGEPLHGSCLIIPLI